MTTTTPALAAAQSFLAEAEECDGPLISVRIGALTDAAEAVERAREEAVAQARAAGLSWSDIGDALGVSRQAAQQRYGR